MIEQGPDEAFESEGSTGSTPAPVVRHLPSTIKQLGDPRKDAGFTLLPAPPGVCSQCARDHEPDEPHDAQSLHYQYTFYAEHDRWPTWDDALAHCSEDVQAVWRRALAERGIRF